MQCYTDLTPPTAVTHSLSLPFLSSTANNLIVVKNSLLQIFALKSVISKAEEAGPRRETANDATLSSTYRSERAQTTKLVLVAEYELAGTVTAIARVKILQSRSGGEAILVALRDAKLSMIEWDPQKFSISTISIHYYERDDILLNPWEPDLSKCGTILSVDPSSRCAVFKFGLRHIAILPFHQIGDDVAMDDYDEALDDASPKLERKPSLSKDGDDEAARKTPYSASFVLSLLALDSTLKNPVHLSFLYEYREPTFGILSSQSATSNSLSTERRDLMSYNVYNLDLEQRASTTLLTVTNLPSDLFEIIPLSRVIGGALLVGNNELIFVDQSGKTNGIAVNEAAKFTTAFPLVDHSSLNVRLEGCLIKQLGQDVPEILVLEATGAMFILSFKIDGRSVSGLNIRRISQDSLSINPSCASSVGRGRLFIGSEEADSVILGWSRPSDRLKRKGSRMDLKVEDPGEDEMTDLEDFEIEDEDDLYADEKPSNGHEGDTTRPSAASSNDDYTFRIHDALINLAPLSDVAFGQSVHESPEKPAVNDELMACAGKGLSGSLFSLQTAIVPRPSRSIEVPGVQGLWAISARQNRRTDSADGENFDSYIFASVEDHPGPAKTEVYSVLETSIEKSSDTDFDPDAGPTIDVATMGNGSRIVQVLPKEVRAFDSKLGLAQILDLDEDNTSDAKVISASFSDSFVLLVKNDQTIAVCAADEGGDLEELVQGDRLRGSQIVSGSLSDDANDSLRLDFGESEDASSTLMFLLTAGGGLHIYRLPSLQQPVYIADGLSLLPPFLSSDFTIRRSAAREDLVEILIAELGDQVTRTPYLLLRSATDDTFVYQPYQSPIEGSEDTDLRFVKLPNYLSAPATDYTPMEEDTTPRRAPCRVLSDLNGFSAVFIPGSPAHFLIRPSCCQPQFIPLAVPGPVDSLSCYNIADTPNGFAFASEPSTVTLATLPPAQDYSTGLPTTRIPLHQTVNALAYHPKTQTYAISLLSQTPFKLPADSSLRTQPPENEAFLPMIESSTLCLFDRRTESITQKIPLRPSEIIMSLKTLSLATSEHDVQARDSFICVGTAFTCGEDLPCMGALYLYKVIPVVPDPEVPATDKALKLVFKEEVRGAVTAISGAGTQGFIMNAQGQKIMVRGLKEDGSLLPVAFMDTMVYSSVCKSLSTSGLIVLGDALGGIWFVGYMEDPYQLRLFAKSPYKLEVITAEFLPYGQSLYIVAVDADGATHVFQYDPENPSTLSGTLLHPTQNPPFSTPHYPTTLHLIPPPTSTSTSPSLTLPSGALLSTSRSGALSLLTPLPPSSHRILSSLQSHLLNTLPHALGLNPRGFRAASMVGAGMERRGGGGGSVVDGNVLRRWMEGGRWRWWGGGEDEGVVRTAVLGALGREGGGEGEI